MNHKSPDDWAAVVTTFTTEAVLSHPVTERPLTGPRGRAARQERWVYQSNTEKKERFHTSLKTEGERNHQQLRPISSVLLEIIQESCVTNTDARKGFSLETSNPLLRYIVLLHRAKTK